MQQQYLKAQTSLKRYKTGVERRQTLGPLRSVNPNMINHFIKQSPLLFSKSYTCCLDMNLFSAANLALAGFPQTNALGENLPSRYLNMFNLRLCNAATIWYFILKFGHLHLCGKGYNHFSPHCCKCNSFGGIAAIICANACHGPHSDSVYSGSKHRQFNSPRLVKHEAGFPSRRRALIGSYQLWRVNDSPYYRE